MMRACTVCGTPTTSNRCANHPRPHAKRNAHLRRAIANSSTTCHICGKPPTAADPFTADHVLAQVHGGQDTITNLRPAHKSCNSRRGRG